MLKFALMNKIKSISVLIFSVLLLTACPSYEPVAVDKCPQVVKHAKQVLGSMAPDAATMMKDCKAATDSERGCVLAATKKGTIARCM